MMASRLRASPRHGGAVRCLPICLPALIRCGGAPSGAAGFIASNQELGHSITSICLIDFHGKSFPPHTQYNCEDDPLSPPEGEATQGGKSPLDPQFRPFFSDACLRPCSTGRGSTDPERPWLHRYPILSLTGFLQSPFFRKISTVYRRP